LTKEEFCEKALKCLEDLKKSIDNSIANKLKNKEIPVNEDWLCVAKSMDDYMILYTTSCNEDWYIQEIQKVFNEKS